MSVRVYVGGLSYKANEGDLKDLFKKYGDPHDISIKRGFAFVEFDDTRDAEDACYDLNGTRFMGEKLTIERARGTPHGRDRDRWGGGGDRRGRSPDRRYSRDGRRGAPKWMDKYGPPTRTENRLIVENLSSTVSWQDLKDFMRKAGEVTYADAHKTRRNEGVVEFRDYKDLEHAIKMLDDEEFKGRRIKLVKEGRKRSRSKSRSRSRSRSRGRKNRRSRSTPRRRKSTSRSRSKTRSRSRSRKHSRSRTNSRSRSRSRSRMRTRSRSREDRRNGDRKDGRSRGDKKIISPKTEPMDVDKLNGTGEARYKSRDD